MFITQNSPSGQAQTLFERHYQPFPNLFRVDTVPGRVNLIGEHIDYHLLPVLPIAIDRHIAIAYQPNGKAEVRSVSAAAKRPVTLRLGPQHAAPAGDWSNYVRAAVNAASLHWPIVEGFDAAVSSDLPIAAGLSSSSALMVAHLLVLLRVNGINPSIPELMKILPEAEQFVGTRGGGMDHAAVIGSHAGCALHIHFDPLALKSVPVPPEWRFLVAHSLSRAEKSGAVREQYNHVKQSGLEGLQALGFSSFRDAVASNISSAPQYPAFEHVVQEARRVDEAIHALHTGNLENFGRILCASHLSLRDKLRISTAAVDCLVDEALQAGAAGARMTGAGFGGCVLIACGSASSTRIRETLQQRYYAKQTGFDPFEHLFFVEPTRGALIDT